LAAGFSVLQHSLVLQDGLVFDFSLVSQHAFASQFSLALQHFVASGRSFAWQHAFALQRSTLQHCFNKQLLLLLQDGSTLEKT
jgi:hypothetical protein